MASVTQCAGGAAWFGLVAAGVYLRLGSLWPPVLPHFVVDLLLLGPG